MTWQKIVRHVSDQRLIVESKSGNQYPVETEYDRLGNDIYTSFSNRKNDHKTYWGWVEFDGGDPLLKDVKTSEECPEKPPWEHP